MKKSSSKFSRHFPSWHARDLNLKRIRMLRETNQVFEMLMWIVDRKLSTYQDSPSWDFTWVSDGHGDHVDGFAPGQHWIIAEPELAIACPWLFLPGCPWFSDDLGWNFDSRRGSVGFLRVFFIIVNFELTKVANYHFQSKESLKA